MITSAEIAQDFEAWLKAAGDAHKPDSNAAPAAGSWLLGYGAAKRSWDRILETFSRLDTMQNLFHTAGQDKWDQAAGMVLQEPPLPILVEGIVGGAAVKVRSFDRTLADPEVLQAVANWTEQNLFLTTGQVSAVLAQIPALPARVEEEVEKCVPGSDMYEDLQRSAGEGMQDYHAAVRAKDWERAWKILVEGLDEPWNRGGRTGQKSMSLLFAQGRLGLAARARGRSREDWNTLVQIREQMLPMVVAERFVQFAAAENKEEARKEGSKWLSQKTSGPFAVALAPVREKAGAARRFAAEALPLFDEWKKQLDDETIRAGLEDLRKRWEIILRAQTNSEKGFHELAGKAAELLAREPERVSDQQELEVMVGWLDECRLKFQKPLEIRKILQEIEPQLDALTGKDSEEWEQNLPRLSSRELVTHRQTLQGYEATLLRIPIAELSAYIAVDGTKLDSKWDELLARVRRFIDAISRILNQRARRRAFIATASVIVLAISAGFYVSYRQAGELRALFDESQGENKPVGPVEKILETTRNPNLLTRILLVGPLGGAAQEAEAWDAEELAKRDAAVAELERLENELTSLKEPKRLENLRKASFEGPPYRELDQQIAAAGVSVKELAPDLQEPDDQPPPTPLKRSESLGENWDQFLAMVRQFTEQSITNRIELVKASIESLKGGLKLGETFSPAALTGAFSEGRADLEQLQSKFTVEFEKLRPGAQVQKDHQTELKVVRDLETKSQELGPRCDGLASAKDFTEYQAQLKGFEKLAPDIWTYLPAGSKVDWDTVQGMVQGKRSIAEVIVGRGLPVESANPPVPPGVDSQETTLRNRLLNDPDLAGVWEYAKAGEPKRKVYGAKGLTSADGVSVKTAQEAPEGRRLAMLFLDLVVGQDADGNPKYSCSLLEKVDQVMAKWDGVNPLYRAVVHQKLGEILNVRPSGWGLEYTSFQEDLKRLREVRNAAGEPLVLTPNSWQNEGQVARWSGPLKRYYDGLGSTSYQKQYVQMCRSVAGLARNGFSLAGYVDMNGIYRRGAASSPEKPRRGDQWWFLSKAIAGGQLGAEHSKAAPNQNVLANPPSEASQILRFSPVAGPGKGLEDLIDRSRDDPALQRCLDRFLPRSE